MVSDTLNGCFKARQGVLGPLGSFDPDTWMREIFEKSLSDDVHLKVCWLDSVNLILKVSSGQRETSCVINKSV